LSSYKTPANFIHIVNTCWTPLYANKQRPSWSWSHGSRIYNYLCNQCL